MVPFKSHQIALAAGQFLSCKRKCRLLGCALAIAPALSAPAAAHSSLGDASLAEIGDDAPDSVHDDTWLSVGIAGAVLPSYEGSDDVKVTPVPLVQGKIGPVRINPRPAGIALDFVPKTDEGLQFSGGINMRYRGNRTGGVGDEVVARARQLDSALEIGPTFGVSMPGLINPYDSLTVNFDTRWDVLGAHNGFAFEPAATYFTPLSRGAAASLTVGAKIVDDDFADYYFSVDAADAAATGLPVFEAEGGLKNLNSTLLIGFDLGGDFNDGGAAVFVAGGYARFFGDAADTPFTSIRGSADQFVGAVGIGYTF